MAGNRGWVVVLVGVVLAATSVGCSDGADEVKCSNEGTSMYAVDHDISAYQPSADAALAYFLASPANRDMPREGFEQVDYIPGLGGSVPLSTTTPGQPPETFMERVPFVHRTGARIDTTLVADRVDGRWAIATVIRCG